MFLRKVGLALLLLIGACSADTAQPPENGSAFMPGEPNCDSRDFEGSPFTICRFDASRDTISLAWKDEEGRPLRSLAALQASLDAPDKVRFAMNAGMYDEEGTPIGLYVENGEERVPLNLNAGPGNFHLLPNGVFSVDAKGEVSIRASRGFAARKSKPLWATQSGPMLVIDGKLHPEFDADGQSRHVRNGVGVRDARTAFFAISEEGVSFGKFARFFRDALGCRNALYLDGSVSSLWDAGSGRQDAYSELGPMLVISSSAR